jgi:tRNA (adenine22-N1)-methyltransferase
MFMLDERLLMCASLVRKAARLADIGTDHAYLPVRLLKNGRIEAAIASDINRSPLESGRATAEKYHCKDIEFRLGAGLQTIRESDRVTDVVIAGMGGELIEEIVLTSPLTKDKNLNLILQPMTKSDELIRALCRNGYEIRSQECAVSHGKCYTAMSVFYTGEGFEPDEVFPYIGKLDLKNPDCVRFVKNHIKNLENKSKGDEGVLPLLTKLKELIEL